MRIQSRLCLLAMTALPLAGLPFAAQAEWPEGARDVYMNECMATASQNVDRSQAEKHCLCGADVIEKDFSREEINALNDRQTPPPPALRERLLQSVAVCKE